MANFDQLKQSVAALIRTNGAEEITGQIMQDVLLTIINSISGGYMFGGVAQHSGNVGNPDYNVFYLAGSGAYTGYGGAITIEAGCYGVFRYNGVWTQEVVDIGVRLSGSIAPGETRGVTGDVINTALQTLFDNVMDILDTLTFTYNTPSAQQATKAMLDVIMTPTGGASHVFATLTLASATVAAAGLMSAEDKQKVDRMLTDFRSLSLTDTTAAADQATKIVQTLSATLGENPEAITTMTFLAATASKAGLMSAADKAVLDCLVAMLGYYECSTAAGTAAKTVAATGYSLTNGGCIRIKMTNANTAANVTLNINSTGAKALYYDGTQASSTNTWDAGEVLEVYYDGTQYQCASGGGGKFATGEAVKDTSITDEITENSDALITSGAVFDVKQQGNTHTEILDNCYHQSSGGGTEDVHITNNDLQNGDNEWRTNTSRITQKRDSLIDVQGKLSVSLFVPASSVASDTRIDRATLNMYDATKRYLSALDIGWRYFTGGDIQITINLTDIQHSDVRYVGVYFGCASGSISPSSINTANIVFTLAIPSVYTTKAVDEGMFAPVKNEVDLHGELLSNCFHGGPISFTNDMFANETTAGAANSKRANLTKQYVVNVDGKTSVKINIPLSAVGTSDRATYTFYDRDKNYLLDLDQGWTYFNGADIEMTYDLTLHPEVRYVGVYFGSDNNIYISSFHAEQIHVTLYPYVGPYVTKAVDTELLKEVSQIGWNSQLLLRDYIGDRVSIGLPFTVKRYSYTYENIGTLSSASGSRQGGAIYGDYLLQFHVNVGAIVFFDLSTKTNVQVLSLTAISNFHAGSGGFSDKFYDVTDPFPLLYIAGMEQKKINVYRITGTAGSFAISLIQAIILNTPYYLPNIAIDAINDRIVVFAYTQNSWGESANNKSVVFYCDIPDYTTAEVTISDFSPVSKFPFIYAEQGAFAQYNMLYLSYGNTDTNAGIIVFNYMNGQVKNVIGVKAIGNLEPEALGAYNDKMIMTDQNGKVYQLTF